METNPTQPDQDERVTQLIPIFTEFLKEADYAFTQNAGAFDIEHTKKNQYIVKMKKSADKDAPRVGGFPLHWNYMLNGRGGNQTREDGYMNIYRVNVGYQHEAGKFKELNVKYYGHSNRKTLYAVSVQGDFPSAEEIREIVTNFWQVVDERKPAPDGHEADAEVEPYVQTLKDAKNMIFHGAPGTGKTYLAKMVAASLVSGGQTTDMTALSAEAQSHIGFVQFHPSYDYTDFVEGLRPVGGEHGQMAIEWRPGVFYQFVTQAREAKKAPYVFIIDEINRGELGKIFGELFYSIDPGYRGPAGSVTTQYANLHPEGTPAFYVPENVYIIGTMNDIDRSVDTFDFAMRRRFRFVTIDPLQRTGMLDQLDEEDEAIDRMKRLNAAIVAHPELNANYQIGPAYFLKLADITADALWSDYLQPLLAEYLRGTADEGQAMAEFQQAYEGTAVEC